MAGVHEALMRSEWCHKAPFGYDEIKQNGKRKIVINDKGKLLQKAFYWKLREKITNTVISERLADLGLILDEKRLSDYFRNPFYCGLLAHNALGGELVEGNHEKMVPKEVFLKVNDIISGNTKGYSCHEKNEVIPLKRFLKCDHCGTAMRGYIVRSKNLPYYKCNTKGCCNNKNANDLHGIFEKGISYLTLTSEKLDIKSIVTKQMIATYNNANKEQENERLSVKKQAEEIDKKIDRLEERLVIEEITPEIFTKFVAKFKKEKLELERVLCTQGKGVEPERMCGKYSGVSYETPADVGFAAI